MALQLQHSMRPQHSPDDIARGRFVSGLRSFILNDLAQDMRHACLISRRDLKLNPAALRLTEEIMFEVERTYGTSPTDQNLTFS